MLDTSIESTFYIAVHIFCYGYWPAWVDQIALGHIEFRAFDQKGRKWDIRRLIEKRLA